MVELNIKKRGLIKTIQRVKQDQKDTREVQVEAIF